MQTVARTVNLAALRAIAGAYGDIQVREFTAQNVGTRSGGSWYRGWFLLVLVLIYASSFVDRIIVAVVGQAVKTDMSLSDFQVGLLGGLAFSVFYSVLGLPIARLAGKFNRVV